MSTNLQSKIYLDWPAGFVFCWCGAYNKFMSLTLEQRAEGAMVGLANGDMMGSPHEGFDLSRDVADQPFYANTNEDSPFWQQAAAGMIQRARAEGCIREYYGPFSTGFWDIAETTDDTSQSVAIAQSVFLHGRIVPADIARRFVYWYDGGKGRGLGGTTALALKLQDPLEVAEPLPWDQASRQSRQASKLWHRGRKNLRAWPMSAIPANGGVMRAPVIGVALHDRTAEELDQAVRDVTRITHDFPACIETSRAAAFMTASCIRGESIHSSFESAKLRYPNTIKATFNSLRQPSPHTGGTYESLAIALRSVLRSKTYEDAIIRAINASMEYGSWAVDTDSYATVAGAIAGAAYGVDAIPKDWQRPVDLEGVRHDMKPYSASYLRSLGRALVA